MSKELVSVDIHQLSPEDIDSIQQYITLLDSAALLSAVSNMVHLDRLVGKGNSSAKNLRESEKIITIPVGQYELLAKAVGRNLLATAEMQQARVRTEIESEKQPFYDEDYPYLGEELYPFPEEL